MKTTINTWLLFATLFVSIHLSAQTKPNIIHIIVDDVGYDDIGCFGAWDIKTPNLDKLASEGLIFTNFYAPHPTCTPTRAAILTGRYAMRMNKNTGLDVLWPYDTTGLSPKNEIAIPVLLKKAGYTSAMIGKWHLGHQAQFLPLNHGFDMFYGLAYPNDHGPERYNNANTLNLPPIQLFEGNKAIASLDNNQLAELPAQFVRKVCAFIREQSKSGTPFYLQYGNIETHTPWFLPKGFEGQSKAGAYGDAVEYMDRSIGIILKQLKDAKLDQNTLVIITSDNGPLVKMSEELENCYGKYAVVDTIRAKKHKLRDGKTSAKFEGGTKVSCVMRWPGVIPSNSKSEHITDGTDLFTTLLTIAGIAVPNDRVIDGKNILELMKSPKTAAPVRDIFFCSKGRAGIYGVRQGKWKLAVVKQQEWWPTPVVKTMLYNLESDPKESTDLSAKYPDKKTELLKMYEEAEKNLIGDKELRRF